CLQLTRVMLENVDVKVEILNDEKYKYLFTVEAVNELVNKGISFREAYQQIGEEVEKGAFNFDASKPLQHTHEGSISQLCTAEIKGMMDDVLQKFA
ncbi:unnamed protein product, partial [marine sediment metagenome]